MNARANNRRTYPLALLFLILTAAAILAAAIGPLLRANDWAWFDNLFEFAIAFVLSALVGSALGAFIGLYHFHRWAGVLCGLAVGAMLGPLAALLLSVGAQSIGIVAPAVIIGSAILLAVAWLIRPAEKRLDDNQASRT